MSREKDRLDVFKSIKSVSNGILKSIDIDDILISPVNLSAYYNPSLVIANSYHILNDIVLRTRFRLLYRIASYIPFYFYIPFWFCRRHIVLFNNELFGGVSRVKAHKIYSAVISGSSYTALKPLINVVRREVRLGNKVLMLVHPSIFHRNLITQLKDEYSNNSLLDIKIYSSVLYKDDDSISRYSGRILENVNIQKISSMFKLFSIPFFSRIASLFCVKAMISFLPKQLLLIDQLYSYLKECTDKNTVFYTANSRLFIDSSFVAIGNSLSNNTCMVMSGAINQNNDAIASEGFFEDYSAVITWGKYFSGVIGDRQRLLSMRVPVMHCDPDLLLNRVAVTPTKPPTIIFTLQSWSLSYVDDVHRAIDSIDEEFIFIFRFHPAMKINIDKYKDTEKIKYQLPSAPFDEVLKKSSLLITNSSTSILDALHNSIPVIFFMPGNLKKDLFDVDLISDHDKGAVVSYTSEELAERVSRFLKTRDGEVMAESLRLLYL